MVQIHPAASAGDANLFSAIGKGRVMKRCSAGAGFSGIGRPAVRSVAVSSVTASFRYPHYHGAADTPDKVNYERLPRAVEGLARVIRGGGGIKAAPLRVSMTSGGLARRRLTPGC
jgi:hypothetical protein